MKSDLRALDPTRQSAIVEEACRRSLLMFHMRAFAIGHPGQQLAMALYIDAMCHQLERVYRGECTRLIITVPPRHGKSELASVSFPSWALGHDPSLNFMIVSYGLELSRLHAEKARTLVGDPRYQRLFPATRIKRGKDKSHVFGTTAGGEWRAISTGGAVTGFGANIMIIDDLHKADEALTPVGREAAIQFYQNSLLSRFDDPANARIVVIQQRLHEEDIVGWLLERGGWHHLNLPAIAEQDEAIPLTRRHVWQRRKGDLLHSERVPMEYLEQRRLELGNRFFGAQYQQNPIIADGGQIRLGWFGRYDVRPERSFFHRIVQSWDTAATDRATSDFSVGMTWGYRDGKWYLLDLIRARMEFPDLLARVLAWHRQWRADALIIEAASTGHSLYQEARRAGLPGNLLCPSPTGTKLDRMAGRTAQLATGDYLLPASAGWLQPLCHELVAFPDGKHDDRDDGIFSRRDFTFDHRRDAYICPGGNELKRYRRAFSTPRDSVGEDGMMRYRATTSDCSACALKPRCCPTQPLRKVLRSIHEGARDLARDLSLTDAYLTSRRERKKVEMLFAHLKRILKLDRLRLRGPNGAKDEFLLAATAQNLRKLAKLIPMPQPAIA